ncbi:MAG: hypothetical protein K2W95_13350 [Candidatus Obscuribacterales bacterium]|nr:hypothetical protein [Candidatus Obscuribacterales bacterium]
MHQSSDKPNKHEITSDEGLKYFPISNMQFDVINVIAEKSKALQAYDRYVRDCKPCPELLSVFERIKADDRRHVEELKKFLDA